MPRIRGLTALLSAAAVVSLGTSAVPALASTTGAQAAHSSSALNPGGVLKPSTSQAPNAKATSNAIQYTSNWSGYAATGGTYTSVSASWTQSAGTCTSGSQAVAFWVGIDGDGTGSVEQTGTATGCNGTTPYYYAWWEMYPNGSVSFNNTVQAGDHFNGSVTYDGGSSYTLSLADTTQGWSHSMNESLSGAQNGSAEAIVEAPSSGGILPLLNFGSTTFTNVDVNGQAIGNFNPSQLEIGSAGAPADTISALSGGNSFTATYGSGGGSGGGGGGSGGGGSGGTSEYVSAASGRCLDDPNASYTPGTIIDVWDCHQGQNQEWTYTSSKQLTVFGFCLDVEGQGTSAGTYVDLWNCNGQANQEWSINSNGTITGVQSGLCLDVRGGGDSANGTQMDIWNCSGAANQKWSTA